MPRFVPNHSYSKIGKNWVLLENLAHKYRKTISILIEILCVITPKILWSV